MTLGVVIPTIGASPFLRKAVASARRQTRAFDEIVVFGNGADRSVLLECLEENAEGVRLEAVSKRLPPHASWNCAITLARSDNVMVLGDDDLLLPNAHEVAARLATQARFATLGFEVINAQGRRCGPCVPVWESSTPAEFYQRLYLAGITLMLPGTVFSRELFLKVGGFRATPFRSAWFIDTDCWMRLAHAAGGARHGREVVWQYRINTGQLGFAANPAGFDAELSAYMAEHREWALAMGLHSGDVLGGSDQHYRWRVLVGRLSSSAKNRLLNGQRLTWADWWPLLACRGLPLRRRLRMCLRVARWQADYAGTGTPGDGWAL